MQPSKRIARFLGDSIFEGIESLVPEGKAKNLGTGSTGWDTPQFLKDFLYQSIQEHENQYGRSAGQIEFIKAIAKEYSPLFGRQIDPLTEIVVNHGATGGLTNACMAFLEEGDEVITFEPGFESYFVQPMIFGGKLRTFPLDQPKEGSDQWTINFENFEKIFNERSRFLIINTPQNPVGKMFNQIEMERFANIAKNWPRLIIITDEVYEHMCYNGNKHIYLGAMEGMWDRVISLFSASKIFSCAGWRVGWTITSAKLSEPLIAAQNWNNLNINLPSQIAVARGLEYIKSTPYLEGKYYYEYIDGMLEKKKNFLVNVLRNSWIKMRVYEPEGGVFIIADITESIPIIPKQYFYNKGDQVKLKEDLKSVEGLSNVDYSPDYAFVRWLADKFNIISIPGYPFFDQTHAKCVKEYKGTNLVRFAFCKSDETLEAVAECLLKK